MILAGIFPGFSVKYGVLAVYLSVLYNSPRKVGCRWTALIKPMLRNMERSPLYL